jgi:hypothetical protein
VVGIARRGSSDARIKNKEDIYQTLTNREMLDLILEQAPEYILSEKETSDDRSRFEQLLIDKRHKIVWTIL